MASEVAVQDCPPAPPVGKPSVCNLPQPTNPSPTGVGGTDIEELLDELLETELELLLEELIDELVVERLELDEDWLVLSELLDKELLLELEDRLDEIELVVDFEMEHSFVPPETLVPAPKVTSPQIKLPLNSLNVNLSARP